MKDRLKHLFEGCPEEVKEEIVHTWTIKIKESDLFDIVIEAIKQCYYNKDVYGKTTSRFDKYVCINIKTSKLLILDFNEIKLQPENIYTLIPCRGTSNETIIESAKHNVWRLKNWISYGDENGTWDNVNVIFL